jgi:sn-glycerol 3-phosphate transport system substrate-binding protein
VSDSTAAQDPIVIEVWLADSPKIPGTDDHSLPGFGDARVAAAESFNRAHPRYRVEIKMVDFRALPEEVGAAVERGNPPDIAEYIYSSTQTALDMRAGNGEALFTPVQRAIGGRTEILGEPVVVDDLLPVLRNYYSAGGELVSMPAVMTTNLLFGNRDVIERAGVGRMPTTWQELTDACAAVAKLPDGPAHGAAWPIYGWLFHMEIAGQGGLFSNHDNGRTGRSTRVLLDSPEMLEYVRWWRSMHEHGYYHYTGEPRDYFSAMEAFADQQVAFVVTSSAVGQFMADLAQEAGFGLMVGQLPRHDALRSPGGPVGGHSFFLAGGLPKEKEDGALAFLQHQLNPEHAVARTHDRSLPLTLAAYEQVMADDWPEPHPGFRIATHQVTSADLSAPAAGPLVGNLNGINTLITYAMEDVLLRGADPQARFRAVNEEGQALLDRHNAAPLAYPPVNPDVLRGG